MKDSYSDRFTDYVAKKTEIKNGKLRANAKCYLCGEDTECRLIEFVEWVCEKDYNRVMKFFDKLKSKRTRYKGAQEWVGSHHLNWEESTK